MLHRTWAICGAIWLPAWSKLFFQPQTLLGKWCQATSTTIQTRQICTEATESLGTQRQQPLTTLDVWQRTSPASIVLEAMLHNVAIFSTVWARKISGSVSEIPLDANAVCSCIADKECPPNSKKLSWMPSVSRPNVSLKASKTWRCTSVTSSKDVLEPDASYSARLFDHNDFNLARSTLPLWVKGREFKPQSSLEF